MRQDSLGEWGGPGWENIGTVGQREWAGYWRAKLFPLVGYVPVYGGFYGEGVRGQA